MMSGPIFKPAGFTRLATIKKVDPATMTAFITFRPDSPSGVDGSDSVTAQLPISYLSSGGGFIGGLPGPGTPVYVSQVEGTSSYAIVGFAARDPAAKLTTSATKIKIPTLVPGQMTIQSNPDVPINLNDDAIVIGTANNSVSYDTTRNLILNTFDYKYYMGQGGREISGIVRRDKRPKTNYPSFLREFDPAYDDGLKIIGMDPIADTKNFNNGTSTRNPARVEKRSVVYEYEEASLVKSDDIELNYYKTGNFPNTSYITDRRAGRADALSLSLVSPNYLVETIIGNVVDIYGNVLDLNRDIIPIGKDATGKTVISVNGIQSTVNESNTFKNIYEQIKRLERRALAYHFEINVKKETGGSGPPDVNVNYDYARKRSRLFIDVDKEGQFKISVPASSETGNIPLHTRYENYSTVYPNSASGNTNDIVFNDSYKDVLAESYSNNSGVIIKDENGNTVGPIDRFSNINQPVYISLNTVYHDITKTLSTLQKSTYYTPVEYIKTTELASGRVLPISDIVSKTIINMGPNANSGGRSGSINLDGSIEINIGANTVDRQSLWLDTQGSIIANIGRDLKNNISVAAKMDGQVLLEVGGSTVPAETNRFKNSNTGWIAGVVDIRVFNSNKEMTILRIDNEGVSITTPGRIVAYANQDILLRSGATMHLEAETLILQGREVLRNPTSGPIR